MSVSTSTIDQNALATPPLDFHQLRRSPMSETYFHQQDVFSRDPETALTGSNAEVDALFQKQVSHKSLFNTASKSSCTKALLGGSVASLLTQNPLPLLLGLSGCFPRVSAQQKVEGEFQINTYTNLSQFYPSAASFINGNFIVTWESDGQDGSSWGIFGQLFDGNGAKIGNEFQVNSYTTNYQGASSVASFSNGNFVVTWSSSGQDGSRDGVYGQLFDGNGAKIENEFRVNSYTNNSQAASSVSSLSNGNFVVTWHSWGQDGSSYGIFGQLFDGNTTKIGSEFQVNSYTNNFQGASSVASFSNGNFVVTWHSWGQDGSNYGVYGQLFDGNGAKIGNEFRVNSYTTNFQGTSSVSSLSNGNFVVTWRSDDQDGSSYGVFGQLFNGNTAKIGNEFTVNSYTNNSQWSPSAASFSNDNFVVTWMSFDQDGSSNGVYGQLFDGNNAKIGNEFKVNSYTNNSQSSPSVTSLSNSTFVVTWQSSGQDGSDYGIYGQIFQDNITYPPISSTTSSSTSSTTSSSTTSTSSSTSSSTTTSSSTSTSSSSTISTTSSTTTSTSKSTTLRSSAAISHARSSSSPPSNKKLLWLGLLLGMGGIICLGGISYLLNKFRSRKGNDDVLATELGKMNQANDTRSEEHYQLTPDFVHPGSDQEGTEYGFTPGFVHPGSEHGETDYGFTPDLVTQRKS